MQSQGPGGRVLLIERNEVSRLGRGVVMAKTLEPSNIVDAVDPEGFDLNRPSLVMADVVVVAVVADGGGFDRYDQVATVAASASGRGDGDAEGPAVVALVGEDNPLLILRLLNAGAHVIAGLGAMSRSGDPTTRELITTARRRLRSGERPLGTAPIGGTNPSAVIDYIVREGIEDAFEPGRPQVDAGLSRRGVMRVRRDLAELGGIRPSLSRYTGGQPRRVELPTWREVVTFVNCARGEVEWGDDAWGNGSGPRIGVSRYGVDDLVQVARSLSA